MKPYLELKKLFATHGDPERAPKMAAYMRDQFKFYGLPAAKRKMLYKELLRREKQKEIVDWPLLDRCYEDEHRECQYFVVDYLAAMQRFLTFEDVPKIECYVRTKQWWDTIDGLDGIIGGLGQVDERINHLMLEWATDDDFWLRRIAINHQLGRKDKTNTKLLETILVKNFGSDEFFINKAIGWSLRDYSKTNPAWVRHFLETHRDKMSKLSLREAGKYL